MKQIMLLLPKQSTLFYPFLICLICFFYGCNSKVGQPIKAFKAQTLNGQTIQNADFKDKVVVINLWATWCGPCVQEIPELNALKEQFAANSDVLFVAISDETPTRIQNFLNRIPFAYTQVSDADLDDALQSGLVHSIPKHIVLDRSGNIHTYIKGAPKDIKERLRLVIEELL